MALNIVKWVPSINFSSDTSVFFPSFLQHSLLDEHLQLQYKNGFIVLHVAKATEKDAGYYIFRAENELGEAETSATVLVLPNFDASIYLDGVNAVDVEDARELQNTQEQGKMHAPQIIQPPRDFYCDAELGRSYFDAKIAPVYVRLTPNLFRKHISDHKFLVNNMPKVGRFESQKIFSSNL